MYTLLNKKRFGIASYFAAFFMVMLLPVVNAIKQVGEGGGSNAEADEKALLSKVNAEAAKAVESFKVEFKEIVTKAAEGKLNKAEVDAMFVELEKKYATTNTEQINAMNEKINQVTSELATAKAELNSLKEVPKEKKSEKFGFGTLLRKSLEKDQLTEEIVLDPVTGKKALTVKNWNRSDLKIQTKAAIDMTTALTQLPGATPGTSIGYLTDYKMQDVQINLNKDTHAIAIFPTDPITGEYMGVLVEYAYWDGAAKTTEGDAPGRSSLKVKTVEFKVLDYAALVRVHKNMLRDLPRLESKLNRIVPDSILGAFDDAVFSATGDNSATAWGLYFAGNYVAYDATDLGLVEGGNASLINLIGKLVLQANNANEDVNTVILHPSLLDGFRHRNDLMGNSVNNRNVQFDSNGNVVAIWGLMVKLNKKQTVGRVTVCWDQAAEIGILEDITMEIGTDGDDFSKGYRTIIYNMRAAFGVGKPGAVFVSTDPTNDIDALNPPA